MPLERPAVTIEVITPLAFTKRIVTVATPKSSVARALNEEIVWHTWRAVGDIAPETITGGVESTTSGAMIVTDPILTQPLATSLLFVAFT